jgi:DNA-3-methyladenine glycosylase II
VTGIRQLTAATLQQGVEVLVGGDPDLRAIVERHGAPPLWARRPGFATIVRIILEQQVSLAAAKTMFERLQTSMGRLSPEVVCDAGLSGLRELGVTSQKASYIVGLAEAIRGGRLDLAAIARAPDDVGRAQLLAMRGLGRWSVDVYYLMALRRPDVWPHGDLALAAAVQQVKGLDTRPTYEVLTAYAQRWSPWRAVAARILWHHYLSVRAVR